MYWTDMRSSIRQFVKQCKSCQVNKRSKHSYGKLPPKLVLKIPWEALCVDLIGQYTIKGKDGSVIDFMCLTMIDPASSWFKIAELPVVEICPRQELRLGQLNCFFFFRRCSNQVGAFDLVKTTIARDAVLASPNYCEKFDLARYVGCRVSLLLPKRQHCVGDMSGHVAGHVADTRKCRVGRVSKTARHLTTCRGIPNMSVIS
jgi:hypothetical protein